MTCPKLKQLSIEGNWPSMLTLDMWLILLQHPVLYHIYVLLYFPFITSLHWGRQRPNDLKSHFEWYSQRSLLAHLIQSHLEWHGNRSRELPVHRSELSMKRSRLQWLHLINVWNRARWESLLSLRETDRCMMSLLFVSELTIVSSQSKQHNSQIRWRGKSDYINS